MKLLSRDEFREGVFKRDRHLCVVCKAPAVDAHHIIERKLFPDGGYYLDNGASLCAEHHLAAEATTLSCDKLRELIGAQRVILPPQFDSSSVLDKWGNPILPDGKRLKGELFYDVSVQRILAPLLPDFLNYVKYPKTYHFTWSPGVNADSEDRILTKEAEKQFEGQRVIVTVKMDGESCSMYSDHIHARSTESRSHHSRNWVKAFHGKISHNIPDQWRLCGENLYSKHSIKYKDLESYFMLFSVWNQQNFCLPWDETKEWAQLLGVEMVPVVYDGIWDEKLIRSFAQLVKDGYNGNECEGYVVRLASGFAYKDFRNSVGKYVRAGHVQTHGHWMRQPTVVNGLKDE